MFTHTRPPSAAANTAPAETARTYRTDIDGLRAVAILLVVVYHVWVGRVSGGVDAFLMISAFFLTGSFVRRLEGSKPLAIAGQWVRTFKRLLPPAAVVLVATLIAGFFLLPDNRLPDLFSEVWASLFYVENWWLAIDATDYYADKISASPVQHFWSLSVQGQVFLLWPLLFLVIRFLTKLTRLAVRPAAMAVFAVVFAASFTYSVLSTDARQEFAYFDTGARIWEFAAGSMLAVALPWIRVPRWARSVLGLVGITALVLCGVLIDVQGGFPGYLALWPVLSVIAIIIAGSGEGQPTVVTRALSFKPLVALGNDAYALYLVHWPILIFAIQLRRGAPLSFLDGLLIVALSLVTARLLTWLVDDRLRHAVWANVNKLRGLLVIALSILLVAGPTVFLGWSAQREYETEKAVVAAMDQSVTHPGAAVLTGEYTEPIPAGIPPIPLAGDLESEWGELPENCDGVLNEALEGQGASCSYLNTDDPELVVAVIGDSHSQQWLEPIEDISVKNDWRTYSFLKGGCALALIDVETTEFPEAAEGCNAWLGSVLSGVAELNPDVVISVGTRTPASWENESPDFGEKERIPEGQEAALTGLENLGIPVVLFRDNPRFFFNAYECADAMINGDTEVASNLGANAACGVSHDRAFASANPAEALLRPGLATVDMSDQLCFDGSCPSIIGNVFVYLDDNHITSTYARTMLPVLTPRLQAAVEHARSWE
ncbi:acyltransferase family protein [Leucobacter sp. BZR 635]